MLYFIPIVFFAAATTEAVGKSVPGCLLFLVMSAVFFGLIRRDYRSPDSRLVVLPAVVDASPPPEAS